MLRVVGGSYKRKLGLCATLRMSSAFASIASTLEPVVDNNTLLSMLWAE